MLSRLLITLTLCLAAGTASARGYISPLPTTATGTKTATQGGVNHSLQEPTVWYDAGGNLQAMAIDPAFYLTSCWDGSMSVSTSTGACGGGCAAGETCDGGQCYPTFKWPWYWDQNTGFWNPLPNHPCDSTGTPQLDYFDANQPDIFSDPSDVTAGSGPWAFAFDGNRPIYADVGATPYLFAPLDNLAGFPSLSQNLMAWEVWHTPAAVDEWSIRFGQVSNARGGALISSGANNYISSGDQLDQRHPSVWDNDGAPGKYRIAYETNEAHGDWDIVLSDPVTLGNPPSAAAGMWSRATTRSGRT